MTYMPKFSQPAADYSHEQHAILETRLLKESSRENLSRVFIEHPLSAAESAYTKRLESELSIIEDKGFCGYFLIVADYVRWAKTNGIAVGPGRGSGPCSLVGFVLGITKTDPIKFNLPFERFVNPDRETLPDFDLEFCDERADEVSAYIQAKYGVDQVAQISSPEIKPLPQRMIIGDRPLAELVPLYENPNTGFLAAKITLGEISDAGLVQFNVINQKALTIIQRKVTDLERSNKVVDIDKIELDDELTFTLLSAGEQSHIAVLDGENYRDALMAIRPDRFEDLCAVIALCYPKLQKTLPHYLQRKRDPESIEYFHPALKSVTTETYGIILYQEQLMHITHKIAGFSMAQGDSFRRTLKSGNRDVISIQKNLFIEGAKNRGMGQEEAAGLFEHIALYGRNTFNKSHAVAHATIAYQTAWLNAHYL